MTFKFPPVMLYNLHPKFFQLSFWNLPKNNDLAIQKSAESNILKIAKTAFWKVLMTQHFEWGHQKKEEEKSRKIKQSSSVGDSK